MRKKPNILFLMCDQMQADVIRPGNQSRTPNFDYLASMGMRFDRAYTPNAICSPARASLMTGLLPHNHGVLCVIHNVDADQACLRADKPHWAQRLTEAGYLTGYFGKWHVERSLDLKKFGWQRLEKPRKNIKNHAITYSLTKYHENPPGYPKALFYGVTDAGPENRGMGVTTDAALKFLDEAAKKTAPWCCFASINEPHDPFICSRKTFATYDVDRIKLPANVHDTLAGRPNIYKKAAKTFKNITDREHREARACYYASVTEIDTQYGRLINKVRAMGQLDNTIIVLTADHGELLGAHRLYCKNISASEEIYNIPLIMAGPGIEKGVVTQARVGLHDLAQTILDLAGCDPIDVPDSRSFASVCRVHQAHERKFRKGFAEYFGGRILLTQRVVWDGPWKFVFNGFDFDELYNLAKDPLEMHNLIDDPKHKNILKKLCAYMWSVIKDTNDHCLHKSSYPILRVAPYGPLIMQKKT